MPIKNMHDLSVIMATYNENISFLKSSIDSVLNQTFGDFEFIIAIEPDDRNRDFLKSASIKDSRMKILVNEQRLGVSGSRNRAIMESSGRYIALIDGDDYCDLRRFEKQKNFLDNNPEVSVVGANMYLIDDNNKIIGERVYPEMYADIRSGFLYTMAIANPTVMMRRKDLEEVGLFDSDFFKAEDFELWLRFLSKDKRMHNLQENLVYYRHQPQNDRKRSCIHWKNNYTARRRYSRLIWPFRQRLFSIVFYFIISHIPDSFLGILLNTRVVDDIRKVRLIFR